jgi:hypothetical protein
MVIATSQYFVSSVRLASNAKQTAMVSGIAKKKRSMINAKASIYADLRLPKHTY